MYNCCRFKEIVIIYFWLLILAKKTQQKFKRLESKINH